ncbi:hypothetical protein Zmor_027288 [Zophobas morio]|uniref:Uncharacterized protein n=1 Tax=Zophobas morio TaxID=2755281 RepID=A0AA38M1Y1_9CUCU|nr:hypothetical protein Zmor_027288 [Zophobas morio]
MFVTPLLLFQFYLFLEKFELAYFVQYGPIYFLMFYVKHKLQKYTTSVIATYLHEIQIWKLEQAPAEIKEMVKKTWFFITLYMLGAVVLSLVVSVLYVIPMSQDKKFIFVFQIANTYFPYLETFFVLVMKPTIFVLTYMGARLFARAHDDTHKKYWFEGSLEGQYLRIAALGVEVITVLAAFVVSGQKIEDAAERVFDVLREVDWYHWNQINKKIYLIFLTNASRVLKIKYSENISLNHKLGIEVVKGVFSAISLTYSLQHKKYTN